MVPAIESTEPKAAEPAPEAGDEAVQPLQRWVWLYAHEAKKLRFQKSYAQFPKALHPIVIGSLFPRSKETLLLDLRSCERAMLAIPFFDTHLPRKLVEIEDAEVVNRLFPATKANLQLSPDVLFDSQIGRASCRERVCLVV